MEKNAVVYACQVKQHMDSVRMRDAWKKSVEDQPIAQVIVLNANMEQMPISDEQREYAWKYVCTNNVANRGYRDGNKEEQYTGILGEVVFADALWLPRPEGNKGYDNGIDFTIGGKNIDLKTMGRKSYVKPFYRNNIIASQVENNQTDVYVFASLHKEDKVLEVIGWMKKHDINNRYRVHKGDTRKRSDGSTFTHRNDAYEMLNKDLTPFDLGTFRLEMTMFG